MEMFKMNNIHFKSVPKIIVIKIILFASSHKNLLIHIEFVTYTYSSTFEVQKL